MKNILRFIARNGKNRSIAYVVVACAGLLGHALDLGVVSTVIEAVSIMSAGALAATGGEVIPFDSSDDQAGA